MGPEMKVLVCRMKAAPMFTNYIAIREQALTLQWIPQSK
jgi:hypothetical protein